MPTSRSSGSSSPGHDDAAIRFMEAYAEETRDATPEGVIESLRSLLPPIDIEALREDLGWFFVESDREAFRNGIWGWFDDDRAFVRPWGFDLSAIRVPVTSGRASRISWCPSLTAVADLPRLGSSR